MLKCVADAVVLSETTCPTADLIKSAEAGAFDAVKRRTRQKILREKAIGVIAAPTLLRGGH